MTTERVFLFVINSLVAVRGAEQGRHIRGKTPKTKRSSACLL
jgi:hypothetical protein